MIACLRLLQPGEYAAVKTWPHRVRAMTENGRMAPAYKDPKDPSGLESTRPRVADLQADLNEPAQVLLLESGHRN